MDKRVSALELFDVDAPSGVDDGARPVGRGIWRTALLAALLAGAVAATSFAVASFTASGTDVRARLMLDRRPTAGAVDSGYVDAQMRLISSRDALRRAAADVGLDASSVLAKPAVGEWLLPAIGIGGKLASPEEKLVDALAARFAAAPAGDGRSIDLRLSSLDSEAAVRFLRHLIDDYAALQRSDGVDVRVLSEPRAVEAPASVSPGRAAGLGGLAALLIVFGWSGLGILHRREARAERIDDTPRPLGTAPKAEQPVPTPADAEEPALAAVAAATPASDLDLNGRKRIAVASFGEDADGRRVVEEMAAETGLRGGRVVVVDLGRRCGDRPGLAELLSGDAGFAATIVRNPDNRAHEIGVGRHPLGGHLDEAAVALLLDTLEQTYDLVLINLGTLRADPAFTLFARLSGQLMLTGDAEPGAVDTLLSALNRRGVGGIVRLPVLAEVA